MLLFVVHVYYILLETFQYHVLHYKKCTSELLYQSVRHHCYDVLLIDLVTWPVFGFQSKHYCY